MVTGKLSTQKYATKTEKKAQEAEEEPEVEVITRVEVIYEDTKAINGVEP